MRKILFASLCLLGACASEVSLENKTPEEMYTQAYKDFQETDYEKAAEIFDQIEQQYPYSEWAERAQIMMAYAQYKQNEYTDATMTLDRFLQLHPEVLCFDRPETGGTHLSGHRADGRLYPFV